MIRIITRTRLVALQQEADQARARSREVQASADAAYARHVRTVHDLSAKADAAEREVDAERADAVILREVLECTEALLASARATVTEQAARIDALSGDLNAMAEAVALLHFGQLHSIHPDRPAAKRHAEACGAAEGRWVASGAPASEVAWCVVSLRSLAVAEGGGQG
ncbi:hypothetical protein ABT112_06595 [Streptomyces sp. NPDC002055]|uniref:hypothetical protein n=1 Tax=Streptomyces sp. NPDC002055 TaxID=3154534 RepID=UPI003318051A